MEAVLFYSLAAVLVTFSALTVTARNPVRAALYLISSLLCVAGLFFLSQAEFVGVVQILVYVGGIMVLFLFVIMLVSVREVGAQPKANRQWRTVIVLAVALGLEFGTLLVRGTQFLGETSSAAIVEGRSGNAEAVGQALYTTYLLPFEIASVLLLVAMVGAIVLAKKDF